MTEHPVLGLHPVGDRQRGTDPGPAEAQRTEHQQHRDARPDARTTQLQECEADEREQSVEGDLDRQTPHLRETRGQRQGHEDLRQREVGQPDVEVGALGLRQQEQHQRDDHHIRRPDADDAVTEIAPDRRMPGAAVRGVDPRSPQQEAGETEEQRDSEVEATEHRSEDRDLDGTGLEGDVGGQHPDRGERSHALELRVEASRVGRRSGGVGMARPGSGVGAR
ncbi:hypothetical protein GOAMI_22_00990 [Gordonia amicalis NBRC 100051 = JCM 11271]|nr:hypothetical protein GOAMI_22_00990 [Gordonia amicalis NBRC 100051 = JCM 11271]